MNIIDSIGIFVNCTVFQGSIDHHNISVRAIQVINSTLSIAGCSFEGNTGNKGGAIYAYNSLNGSVFIGNRANEDGGAIFSRNCVLSVSGSKFEGNIANCSGGVISVEESTVDIVSGFPSSSRYSIQNSITEFSAGAAYFSNNEAYIGGAIYAFGCCLTFSGSVVVFSNNCARTYGGALSSVGSEIYRVCPRAEKSSLRWSNDSNVSMKAHHMCFIGNTAKQDGGAINLLYSSFLLGDNMNNALIEFTNNSAEGNGGAIDSISSLFSAATERMNFANNRAHRNGGAVHINNNGGDKKLEITANLTNNTAGFCGGAGHIRYAGDINFINILATGNSHSAFCLYKSHVTFSGTTNVSKNSAGLGGGIRNIFQAYVLFTGHALFEYNSAYHGGAISSSYKTTLILKGSIEFKNNTATNRGGAIYAIGTNITLPNCSVTSLSNNSAKHGGAIYFSSDASLTLNEGSSLITSNNHATEYGGAIYHEDSMTITQCKISTGGLRLYYYLQLPSCFIQLKVLSNRSTGTTINSYNDTSKSGGNFMYGGLLDRCQMDSRSSTYLDFLINSYKELKRNIKVDSFHAISSQPYQLCFCKDAQPFKCSEEKIIEVHRGQNFNISLLALDQSNTSIETQVTAKPPKTASLKLNQSLQDLQPNCSTLTYALYSTQESEKLVLYLEDASCRDTGVAKVAINVTLLPCPNGFIQSNGSGMCVCGKKLSEYDAKCKIDDTTYNIVREHGSQFWVKAEYKNGSYQGVIRYKTCPADYCTDNAISFTLDNSDIQCANNRSGVLCGKCATNYSLMLGSSRCGECSNTYLALLLPFAAAGIALVVFLSILRLTVATGMINSVILYVDITKVIIFSDTKRNVLTIFIAWMNLDLGIETCFYDGMTAYANTWLQIVFPTYIWFLLAFIVLISRYSITASKLIGHNPIAVLATLLLMSYTKVLEIIIEVYQFADLEYPHGNRAVWLKDANVPYLQSNHLMLTLVTTLILVFFFLPYTLLLLLGYKLHYFSGKKYFRWFNKIKPLLDSYYAPYKKNTRYWTGFLLLVRCALYIVLPLGGPRTGLLAIVITFTVIGLASGYLHSGRIYSSSYVNIIEYSVYSNLIILSAVTLSQCNSPALVYSLIVIVFVTMIAIIVYHFHITYIAQSAIYKWLLKIKGKTFDYFRRASTEHEPDEAPPMSVSSTSIDLREILLDNSYN